MELFYSLLQVSLGTSFALIRRPCEEDWYKLLSVAEKQSVVGLCFSGVCYLYQPEGSEDQDWNKNHLSDALPETLYYEWASLAVQIQERNAIVSTRSRDLTEELRQWGYSSCVLKGQGLAELYEDPSLRQSGDIDLWVQGDRDEIIQSARSHNIGVGSIDIKHAEMNFYNDVSVEIHFLPSWMYCPITNRRLQKFFSRSLRDLTTSFDESLGFRHPRTPFNLVFVLVHIYRHFFSEGIGLRQFIDYARVLRHSTLDERNEALCVLQSLHMQRAVGGAMYIMKNILGIDDSLLLCHPDDNAGRLMLSELNQSGNFGQYDSRYSHLDHDKRFRRGIIGLRRNLKYLRYFPEEVIWSPIWKLWHYCWRKMKGYI